MNIQALRDQTCCCLQLIAPELGDSSVLVDECLADASSTFSDHFICQCSPATWARITLSYHKHFVETGCDVSIAEMFAEVIRDSINTKRMDYLTLKLSQLKKEAKRQACAGNENRKPNLALIKK